MKRNMILIPQLLLVLSIALIACAPSATPGTQLPKPGHWTNDSGKGANASFDLSSDGQISNFNMTAFIGVPTEACPYKIDRPQLQVNHDGTFVISYSMEYADVAQKLGPAVMEVFGDAIPKGQPYEVLHISGNATDTTMNGTYKITVCGATLYLGNNTGSWNAQWKNS